MRIIGPKTAKRILNMMGWQGMDEAIPAPKCIILGAPHTSIWDFVISWLYYRSVGGNAKVMIKKGFFKWPLGPILRHLGGSRKPQECRCFSVTLTGGLKL